MSEEEKEAILHFKKYENKLVYEINEKDKRYAKTILNYIDKLQEENTSLKKEIKLMKSVNINENFISKDKIRNKIKELEARKKNLITTKEENFEWHIINNIIFVLEELLGDKDD